MGQIVLTKPNGDLYPLVRNYPVTYIDKAEQTKEILGRDDIILTVGCAEALELPLGTKMDFAGEEYFLNVVPRAEKNSKKDFGYDFIFEAYYFKLIDAVFLDVDATGNYRGAEFSLIGDLPHFAGVLINAANLHFGSGKWVLGEVAETETQMLAFTNLSVLAGMQQICKAFDVEFRVDTLQGGVRRLNLKKFSELKGLSFAYGKNKGAKSIKRIGVSDSRVVNRVYPYGSSENLPVGYRNNSPRLRIGDNGHDYVEDAESVALIGVHALAVPFDDIKPQYIGSVTATDNVNLAKFTDIFLEFDLFEKDGENDKYLVPGKSAKITFQDGGLAGKVYEIADYVHATKTFTLVRDTDSNGLITPDHEPFLIKHGDKYIITDIQMPASYVASAEALLRTKGTAYVQANKFPMVQYAVDADPAYIKSFVGNGTVSNLILPGDLVTMNDDDLNIDKAIRITRFTRDVLDPNNYEFTVADSFDVSYYSRTVAAARDLETIVRINDLRNPQRAKDSYRIKQELLNSLFDTDGFFDPDRIKPLSIQTSMLAVGAKSQQLILNIVIEPNYNGQQDVVLVRAGTLTNYTIEPTIRTWNIDSQSTSLGASVPYYIYAKCSRTTNQGTILFDTAQIKTDDDGSYYHFLLGVLHSPDESLFIRRISLTYGFTTINGRFVTTGIIQSNDGTTYFDLDSGEIGGKITFRAADGSRKLVADLYEEQKDFVELVTENMNPGDGLVETWFYLGDPTLANQPAINWDTNAKKDEHLNDLYYNTSTSKSFRFVKSGGTYSWSPVVDSDISAALALAAAAKDTADGKRRVFVITPYPPYDVGDLWANGVDLKVCITQRQTGAYQALDWDDATTYDNTVTTINGGIVTSGRIQLAGEGGSILAGISGEGTIGASVRFWAGATFGNRAVAPFRVTQDGEVFARKRIEMMSSSNVGQAGICGADSIGDGEERMWAGAPYGSRSTAPFRVLSNGRVIATTGLIGNWEISSGGLVNNAGTAYMIMRSSLAAKQTSAMIGTNILPSYLGGAKGASYYRATEDNDNNDNYAIITEAANATGIGMNFNFFGMSGITFMDQMLQNGSASLISPSLSNVAYTIDPSRYSYVEMKSNGDPVTLNFDTTRRFVCKIGKRITIQNSGSVGFLLKNILRYNSSFAVAATRCITIVLGDAGYWYLESEQ